MPARLPIQNIPSFLTRRAVVNRALDSQDLANEKQDEVSSRDQFNQAFKQAQLESRASSAEDRASALRDQNEAMNQIRQQQADVQSKLSDLKDAQTQAQLQKQNYDLDRQVRAEKDAAAYLNAVKNLNPADPKYRIQVTSALADYPLALESKPALEHFAQAGQDALKYEEQNFHLKNIPLEAQAKIDAAKGIVNVETAIKPALNADGTPILDPVTKQPVMTTESIRKTVVPADQAPPNPVQQPIAPVTIPAVPSIPVTGAQIPPVTDPSQVQLGNGLSIAAQPIQSPVPQPAAPSIPLTDNSEAAISQRYFGK